jgi:alkanesulfonate monooxygenase SsuD/methylene tetrahydromethanopterin reductase-like flavin-dependent oxidoreductase (luciferase family)
MELDVFFSICQVAVDGYKPSERVMMENFFEQVRAADRLGYGTAWLAESHLSTESQKKNPGAVVPHFEGEIGLNVDFLQLATRIFATTERLHAGSAVMNILCNGGPIAAAERVKAFLLLHSLNPGEKRRLEVGFAQGRFPYINAPYGIVPRSPVEKAAWEPLKSRIFTEATEIFLRLIRGEELASSAIETGRKRLTREDFRKGSDWEAVLMAHGSLVDAVEIAPWWKFDTLQIIPREAPLDHLRLTIGSHEPPVQVFANRYLPVGVFNLSITSRDVVESTHERMQKAYNTARGPWSRSLMPRTTLVFLNADPGVSKAERNARAREHAQKALAAYWTALEGTLDPKKVESATDNALVGDPDVIEAQMRERFDPDDRLMLWFDFFNHDSKRVVRDMELFMSEIAPRFPTKAGAP